MSFPAVYITISVIFILGDIAIAMAAFRSRSETGKLLGYSCLAAASVCGSYAASVFCRKQASFAAFSAIYFSSIDWMLVCLLVCVLLFIGCRKGRMTRCVLWLCGAYAAFESVVFAINIFHPFAVSFLPVAGQLYPSYEYGMHALYIGHLIFTYSLVTAIVAVLIYKIFSVPKEYRYGFAVVIAGTAAIVGVNAVFLFFPGDSVYARMDYSVLGYTVVLYILYWSGFVYATRGMAARFKSYAFNSVDQGVVVFDYSGQLIVKNERATELLGNVILARGTDMDGFMDSLNMKDPAGEAAQGLEGEESRTFRVYVLDLGAADNGIRPLRCDSSTMRNKRGQLLGHLFTFTDEGQEKDLLTGFTRWKTFQQLCTTEYYRTKGNNCRLVVACDINGLAKVNRNAGSEAGDRLISRLAEELRRGFDGETMFVRGPEAVLLVMVNRRSEQKVREILSGISRHYGSGVAYAIASAESDGTEEAVHSAIHAMQLLKMFDRNAARSETLNSLIRALQQSDTDTEAHVRRTQISGAALADRLGLSDEQKAELRLLCLLHDIGKIGVPVEILNKPGSLSESEWNVLRTHSRKGYQIALSSPDTACIADAVLHHHERWDGKGYPDGIAGQQIPLLSRIISVVDSFDAMVSNRAYRKAMSGEYAIAELERCAGTQFDPLIVGEFVRLARTDPRFLPTGVEKPANTLSDVDEGETVHHPSQGFTHVVKCSKYILDDKMRIISVDENFEALTGYSPADVERLSLTQRDLLPVADREEYTNTLNGQLAGHPFAYMEHRILRKDGRSIYVLCSGRDYFDSSIHGYRSEIIMVDCAGLYTVQLMCGGNGIRHRAGDLLDDPERNDRALSDLVGPETFAYAVKELLVSGRQVMLLAVCPDREPSEKTRRMIARTLCGTLRPEDIAGVQPGDVISAAIAFDAGVPVESIRERARQIFDRINMRLLVAGEAVSVSAGFAVSASDETVQQLTERTMEELNDALKEGCSLKSGNF